jgi:hypothetical protein
MNFGVFAGALAARLPDKHLAFFDAHLRGKRGSAVPPVEYFLCGANEWLTASDWPPPESQIQHWYLHSEGEAAAGDDGRLDLQIPDSDEPEDRYVYDPANPVPSHGGRALYLGRLVGGPLNQRHLETRDDVLCYTSSRLDQPIDIAGTVALTLYVSSTAPDTDFVAKLCDVHPDGRSIVVCDGSLRTRYRCGFNLEVALEPETFVALTLDLGEIAWRFAAGHRLRLDVTSSNFPHLDRNLNTGHPLGTDREGVSATQVIAHSATKPSHLTLPILPS